MASDGFKWEVNYIGLMAHAYTSNSAQSLQAWFQYDASIGLGQIINIKGILTDRSNPTNPLTASSSALTNGSTNLATDCGATNTQQVLQCVVKIAATVPGFQYKWYLYDEPGCPNQSLGYCQTGYPSNSYANLATVASYLHSIDPSHIVMGANVGAKSAQGVSDMYSWLMGPNTPMTLFDWYSWPTGMFTEDVSYTGPMATNLANKVTATYPAEQIGYVAQAFSGAQSDIGAGYCGGSFTTCPFPTEAQMQRSRDLGLYYANQAGHPLSLILWYEWQDLTCENTYPGCNAAANRASLKSAAFAPFPATAPQ